MKSFFIPLLLLFHLTVVIAQATPPPDTLIDATGSYKVIIPYGSEDLIKYAQTITIVPLDSMERDANKWQYDFSTEDTARNTWDKFEKSIIKFLKNNPHEKFWSYQSDGDHDMMGSFCFWYYGIIKKHTLLIIKTPSIIVGADFSKCGYSKECERKFNERRAKEEKERARFSDIVMPAITFYQINQTK